MTRIRALLLGVIALFAVVTGSAQPAAALTDPELLVENARLTVLDLLGDPEYAAARSLSRDARAILVFPNLLKAGFILGGEGGTGVMLVHQGQGSWTAPAFYTLGGASFGLQIGGQSSQVLIIVMTEKGLNAVLDRNVTLGADASIAVGELGGSVGAATGAALSADMYIYAKTAGLFGGLAFAGSVLAPRTSWDEAYYGNGATARAIVTESRWHNPQAEPLQRALP